MRCDVFGGGQGVGRGGGFPGCCDDSVLHCLRYLPPSCRDGHGLLDGSRRKRLGLVIQRLGELLK
eukprot:COSAG01_NODE_2115_length_8385_cov_65.265870_5_plen_65_part_00